MKVTFLFIIERLLLPVKKTWYTKGSDNKALSFNCYKSEKDASGKDRQLPFDSNSTFFSSFICREIRETFFDKDIEHDSMRNRMTPIVKGEASKHCRAFGKIAPLIDGLGTLFTSQTAKICSFVANDALFVCSDDGIIDYRSDFEEIKIKAGQAEFEKVNGKSLCDLAEVFNKNGIEILKRIGFKGKADRENICELLSCAVILAVLDGEYLSSGKVTGFGDEVIKNAEDELCSLAENAVTQQQTEQKYVPPLKSRTSQCSQVFYGRDDLLEEIDQSFKSGINVIFLKGMGGIGKSELARQYALKNRDSIENVVFARYEEDKGLVLLVADDEIFAVRDIFRDTVQGENDQEYAKRKIKALRQHCGSETLIIIDNYDTEKPDELLSYLVSDCPYRVLITTRFDQEKRYKQILVGEIEDEEKLKDLVISYCDESVVRIDREDASFGELFRLTRCHTLTLELVAMYMSENSYSLKETVDILKKAGFEALSDSYVTHNDKNETAYGFIRELFKLTALSEDEKSFLRHMSLTSDRGVPNGAFRDWNGDLFKLCRTRLIKKRLLCYDSDTDMLFLHPIIGQVVLGELDVSYDNCREFLNAFTKDIDDLNYSNFSMGKKKAVGWCGLKIMSVLGLTKETFQAVFESGKAVFSIMSIPEGLSFRLGLYEFAEANFGKDSMEACMTSIQTAHAYMEYGDYEKALYMQKKNLVYLENEADKEHVLYYDLLERCADQLGYIFMRMGKSKGDKEALCEAEKYFLTGYEAADKIKESQQHSENLILFKHATPVLGLCSLYFEQGKLDLLKEKIAQFEIIIDTLKGKGYFMEYDTSYLCVLKGKYSMLTKDYVKAEEEFESAIGYRLKKHTNISTTVMECYLQLAICRRELGKSSLEKENLISALEIAQKLYTPSHSVFVQIKERLSRLEK